MNPRNIGAPGKETGIGDPLELFLPESGQAEPAQPTPPRELGDFPLRPSTRLAAPVSMPRVRPRRSVLRSVSAARVVAASLVVALIAGAALGKRFDVSALSNYFATALSDYVVIDRTSTPAPTNPLTQVARGSATTESAVETTGSRQVTVGPTKNVAAANKPAKVTPRAPQVIERRQESRPPARAVATTASPAVPPASSALRAPAVSSPPPAPAVSSPPPAPAVSSPPPAPTVSSPPPMPAVSSATVPAATSAAPVSVPSAAPAPAPVTAPSATSVASLGADTRAVTLALNRYQQAFSALDVGAARTVWPSVDARALAKAFDQLEEQTFELEGCNITVAGAQAEADCGGNARYVRKVGSKAMRVEPRRWHFKLRQANEQWVIDAVNAR